MAYQVHQRGRLNVDHTSEPAGIAAPPSAPAPAGVFRFAKPAWLWLRRLWPYGAPLALCFGCYLFATNVDVFLPLKTWQFPRFAYIWLVALLWGAVVTGGGHAILRWCLCRTLPLVEHLALAFPIGLLLFQLGVFLCGLAGFLSRTFYYALPIALAVPSAWPTFRFVRRAVRHFRGKPLRLTLTARLVTAFGVLGLALMYVPIITPSHIGFDSGMYHVPIAEHYLAAGAIRRFADGWIVGTYPQMASLIYTWALRTPGLEFLDKIVLLAHMELVIFLSTLVGVAALASALLGPGRGRLAWVACFLFPCLYLHDLQLAADHLAALWFAPLYLCLFRAYKTLDPRFAALTGACAAGALLTKYTAYPMLVAPVLIIALRGVYLLVRPSGSRLAVFQALAISLATALVLTAPHWLKNLIWYGDPLYPMLGKYLHLHPWNDDAALVTEVYLNKIGLNRPEHSWAGVWETFKSLYTFSFNAYEFYEYHRNVPYFGSLFTVATLALPFLRPPRRVWVLLVGIYISLFAWYWLSHSDRYLQAFLPGMAAIVATAFTLCWSRGWLFRVPVAAAIALQLVWGADVFAIPVQVERYRRALSTIGATYNGSDSLRSADLGSWMAVGEALPKRAVLVVHDAFWHLGVQRQTVNDWVGLQGGVNYGRLASARDTYELFRGLGVTHLAFGLPPMNDSSLAADLRFNDFAQRIAVNRRYVGGILISQMPPAPPAREGADLVLVQACNEPYAPGLYEFAQTNVPALRGLTLAPYPGPQVPLEKANTKELVSRATFAVLGGDSGCHPHARELIRSAMREIGSRGKTTLWSRATH